MLFRSSKHDIAVMGVKGDGFVVGHVDGLVGSTSFEQGVALARQLLGTPEPVHCLYLLASGIDIANDAVIEGIESVLGPEIVIFGATSSDQMQGVATFQCIDGVTYQHAAFAVGFWDPTLTADTQATHGFLAEGAPMVVTRSEGNRIIELDGPEVPIMDGSAAPFVSAIDRAGIVTQNAKRRYLKVLKTVRVAQDDATYGELRPYAHGFRVEVDIEFNHPLIGHQALALEIDPESFRREISRARTFGFMRDVAKLWNAGYALGASFENTLVITENRVLNPEGLRHSDEFARHKALDAIGDLTLAGAPLLGAYRSVRGGHKLNHAVLSALMADPSAWTMVDAPEARQEAPRRVRGHADVATGLIAPAYGPEVS